MNITHRYKNEILSLVEACHRLGDLGYVTSSGGNLSLRVDDDLILITPTKTTKRTMRFKDICAVDLKGNTVFAPQGKRPTGETPFHTRIMRKRPDVKAIAHAHPPVLTGFAIANSDILAKAILPEPVTEVGPALLVPYETPVSEALSQKFDDVVENSNCFLMENHGAVLCNNTNIFDAVEQLQMMECMAISVMTAMQLGNFKPITERYIKEMDEVVAARNLVVPGLKGKYRSVMELYRQ